MSSPGQQLRILRERLGLTMRDVESASLLIAQRHGNEDFAISLSWLSDMETKRILPSIFRFYALAVIYRSEMRDIMAWYGVDSTDMANDLGVVAPPKSHLSSALARPEAVRIPVRMDPAFDSQKSSNLGRMVEQWGVVPLSYLAQFANLSFTYGYIGLEDFTMYPLLMPGSFVQVDESRNRVISGMWRSEYERPVYFVETREGYTCCWCDVKGDIVVLQPHPLSPVSARVLKFPREAEVVGQVVGVAMRLGEWRPLDSSPNPKEPAALT